MPCQQPVTLWVNIVVTLGALAVTVGVTVWLAYRQVRKQRKLASDRATLNFIASHEIHNADWRRLEVAFSEQMGSDENADKPPPWKRLLNPVTQSSRKDALDVRSFLNHYELVAIAIREGIINESLYATWYRKSYVRIWERTRPYVLELREMRKSDEIYCNLQKQADKWRKSEGENENK